MHNAELGSQVGKGGRDGGGLLISISRAVPGGTEEAESHGFRKSGRVARYQGIFGKWDVWMSNMRIG